MIALCAVPQIKKPAVSGRKRKMMISQTEGYSSLMTSQIQIVLHSAAIVLIHSTFIEQDR